MTGIDLGEREVQFAEMAPLDVRLPGARARRGGQLLRGRGRRGARVSDVHARRCGALKEHVLQRWEAADRDPSLVEDGALNVVVVGGGPTGVESAGALAELYRASSPRITRASPQEKARIVLVEAGPSCSRCSSTNIRAYTQKALEKRSVEVLLGEIVASVTPTRVTLKSGTVLDAHTLVWGAGLQASPLVAVARARAPEGNRIAAEPDLSLAGHPRCSPSATSRGSPTRRRSRCSRSSARSRSRPASTPARTSRGASRARRPSRSSTTTRARWRRSDAARRSCRCRGGRTMKGRAALARVGRRPPRAPVHRRGPGQGGGGLDVGGVHARAPAAAITREHGARTRAREGVTMARRARTPAGTETARARERRPADVFVVFGITGDLAKVMTFRSLYRLEQRGLLDCPIVGVAVDDWTVDQLVERARDVDRGNRRAARRGGLRPLRRPALLRAGRLRRRRDLRARRRGDQAARRAPVFYLEIPPFLFGTVVKGLAEAGLTQDRARRRREAVRPRPRPRPARSPTSCTSTSTSRSSTGSTTTSGRWASRRSSTSGSRTRCSSRSGTGTTSSACRSRWRRTSASRTAATSTTRSARCATSSSTTSCRSSRAAAMEPPGGRRPDDAQGRAGRALPRRRDRRPGALRARPVRRLPRRSTASPPDSTTETYAALRLDIDNWRWSGVPFFIRTGKRLPVDPDRGAARLQAPAAARLRGLRPTSPSPTSSSIKLDPSTGVRLVLEARRADTPRPEPIKLDMEFAEEGGEGADAVRGAAPRGDGRPEHALHPPGRRRGDVADHAAAARRAAAGRTRTRRARGAREAADDARRRPRPLARPLDRRHERRRPRRGRAAERGRAVAVPADRRLRVPLQLPHRRARRARRRDRLALRAALRLAERVRQPARPAGRASSASAPFGINHPTARVLRAGHERARDDLEDAGAAGSSSATR